MNELFRRLLLLPEQASTIAPGIDHLHYVVISISVLGAFGVATAVAYMLIHYRHSPGRPHQRRPHIPLHVELGIIGSLLVMFVVFWVIGFRQFVQIETPPDDATDVYVVAKQWMWTFAYPNGTASTDDVYVPANRPIRLVMTSRDVIHSFYVPDFRIKQDVVPGRTTVAWFEARGPGIHDIFCAEYCGLEHSHMHGHVVVLGDGDWARWADGHREHDDLATVGGRLAATHGCLRCHTVDGTPHLGPTWAGLYGSTIPLTSGQNVLADEAYLTESMMDPEREIHAGFPPIMPTYRGVIEGADVAAIVAYIKSLPPPGAGSPLPVAPLPVAPIIESRAP